MESNPFVSGAVGASIATVFYIAVRIFQYINHTRFRSSCCGKKIEATIDVDKTSPVTQKHEHFTITNPAPLQQIIVPK